MPAGPCVRWTARFLIGALAGMSVGLAPAALSGVGRVPERLLVVDCLLPAKVRRLGGVMTYLAPRQALKTIADECEIRGGEYTAFDRANFATSLAVWKPQAEQGDAQAQVYVGEIYEKGLGTTPDYTQAALWYQKAADQGSTRGLSDLAYLYEQGMGVPKDPVKALNLYRKSAGLGNDELTFASDVASAKQEAAAQIDALTEQLASTNEQNATLQSQLEQAQSQARDKADALERARRESRDLRRRLEQLKAAPASAANPAEVARLQSQLSASEAKIAQDAQEAQAAQAVNEAKTAELSQRLAQAAAEDEQLRAQLGGHTIDAQQARAEMAAAHARIDTMNAQIKQLQEELDAERARAAADRSRLAATDAHDASLAAELKRLRQSLAERESRLTEQQRLLSVVQAQRDAAEREIEHLKAQQSTAEGQPNEQRVNAETLRAQLASVQERLLQSQQQLSGAHAVLAEERSQVEIARAQLALHRSSAGGQAEELEQLAVKLRDSEARVIGQQTRIAALEAQYRIYTEEMARLKSQQLEVGLRSVDAPAPGAAAPGATTPGAPAATPTPTRMSPKELNLSGYYALIIGNDDYQNMPKLQTAANDARAVDKVLREHYGFKTKLLLNATRADILTALNDYRLSLGDRDSFLIYYAGHGELIEKNLLGYWLPVNAKRDDNTEWISDRMVTDQIGLMPARHILVIADSCYSGAMTRSTGMRLIAANGAAAESKRLAKLALLPSRTVLTSGGVAPVLDGGAGANSIFARVLIDALARNTGVLEGSTLYDELFDPVRKAAARFNVDQRPRYSALADAGHLNGEFLLIPVS